MTTSKGIFCSSSRVLEFQNKGETYLQVKEKLQEGKDEAYLHVKEKMQEGNVDEKCEG